MTDKEDSVSGPSGAARAVATEKEMTDKEDSVSVKEHGTATPGAGQATTGLEKRRQGLDKRRQGLEERRQGLEQRRQGLEEQRRQGLEEQRRQGLEEQRREQQRRQGQEQQRHPVPWPSLHEDDSVKFGQVKKVIQEMLGDLALGVHARAAIMSLLDYGYRGRLRASLILSPWLQKVLA